MAHVMAYAVQQLYPAVKFGIGPVIEDGFYYDFDSEHKFSQDDFNEIEKKMRKIISEKIPVEHVYVNIDEALKEAKVQGQRYKMELLSQIKSGERLALEEADIEKQKKGEISFYSIGHFTDLCRGPHATNTGDLPKDGFKLSHVAGAYWLGKSDNPQMQRIYAVAFEDKDSLQKHLNFLEEVKKRDHRVLAQQLDLFSQHDISPGAIFWHPKGMIIWKELEKYIRNMNEEYGYGEVSTPVMVKKSLYETSGHWDHYRENGFWFDIDEETYVLKPMNCPEATLIYSNKVRSYRDLPIRLAEPTGKLHRNELRGVLGGLFRVRQFVQDDAHVYCAPDQIESEVSALISYTNELYKVFSIPASFKLSTKPDKAMGDPILWKRAESALEEILKKLDVDFEVKPKDGAFYGPKIDIHAKDAIGREHQLATIQLDFQMPERFKLEYVAPDGSNQRPVMIHRAIYGSFERFIGVLIEHYIGAFPVWISPVQAIVIPVSEKYSDYALKVATELRTNGIRCDLSGADETLGKRIREAEMQKTPYILIVGEKEFASSLVAVRQRSIGDIGQIDLKDFVNRILEEIREKK